MAYENLKTAIKQAIKQNGNQEITGSIMQSTLLNIVNTIADETTRAKAAEAAIVFDVSVYNNGSVFESLKAILSSPNLNTLIPTSVRRGGMAIRFIQGSEQSSDNKYVQYRLMSDTFSTTVTDWQGVDEQPTAGSDNLVKSGGVDNKLAELEAEVAENALKIRHTLAEDDELTSFYYDLQSKGCVLGNEYYLKVSATTDLGEMTIKAHNTMSSSSYVKDIAVLREIKQGDFRYVKFVYENRYFRFNVYQGFFVSVYENSIIEELNKKVSNEEIQGISLFRYTKNWGKTTSKYNLNDVVPNSAYSIYISGNLPNAVTFGVASYNGTNYKHLAYCINGNYVCFIAPDDCTKLVVTREGDSTEDVQTVFEIIAGGLSNKIEAVNLQQIEQIKAIEEKVDLINKELVVSGVELTSWYYDLTNCNVSNNSELMLKIKAKEDLAGLTIDAYDRTSSSAYVKNIASITSEIKKDEIVTINLTYENRYLRFSTMDLIIDIYVDTSKQTKENGRRVYYVDKGMSLRNTISEAVKYPYSTVVVRGTFNLANEFAAELAENPKHHYGIQLSNGIRVIFKANSFVSAIVQDDPIRSQYFEPFSTNGDCEIDGLNIEVENTRYCVHDDTGNSQYVKIKNCVMKNLGGQFFQCIGGGFGVDKFTEIDSCIFESYNNENTNVPAVSYHNGQSASSQGKVIVKNCLFKNDNNIEFYPSGTSTKVSNCIVNNCKIGRPIVVTEPEAGMPQNITLIDYMNEVG